MLFELLSGLLESLFVGSARPPIDTERRRRFVRLGRRSGLRVVGDGLLLVEKHPRYEITVDTGLLRADGSIEVIATTLSGARSERILDAQATDAEILAAVSQARDACTKTHGYRG